MGIGKVVDFGYSRPLADLEQLGSLGDVDQLRVVPVSTLFASDSWAQPDTTKPLADSHIGVRSLDDGAFGVVASYTLPVGADGDPADADGQGYALMSRDLMPARTAALLDAGDGSLPGVERERARRLVQAYKTGVFAVFEAVRDPNAPDTTTGYHDLRVADIMNGGIGPSVFGIEYPFGLGVISKAEGEETISIIGGVPYPLGTTGNRKVLGDDGYFVEGYVPPFRELVDQAVNAHLSLTGGNRAELSGQSTDQTIANMCLRIYELLSDEGAARNLSDTSLVDTLTLHYLEKMKDAYVFWEAAYTTGSWLAERLAEGRPANTHGRKSLPTGASTDHQLTNRAWKQLSRNPGIKDELAARIGVVAEAANRDALTCFSREMVGRFDDAFANHIERSSMYAGATDEQRNIINRVVAVARTNPVRLLAQAAGPLSGEFEAALERFATRHASGADSEIRALAIAARGMLTNRQARFNTGDQLQGGASGGLAVTYMPTSHPLGSAPYQLLQNELRVSQSPPFIHGDVLGGEVGPRSFGPNASVLPKSQASGPDVQWVRDGGEPSFPGLVCGARWRPFPEMGRAFPPAIIAEPSMFNTGGAPEDQPPNIVFMNVGELPNMVAKALLASGPAVRGARLSDLLSPARATGTYDLVRYDSRVETTPGAAEAHRTSTPRRIASATPGQLLTVRRHPNPAEHTGDLVDAQVTGVGTGRKGWLMPLLRRGPGREPASNSGMEPPDGSMIVGRFISGAGTLSVVKPRTPGDEFIVVRPED